VIVVIEVRLPDWATRQVYAWGYCETVARGVARALEVRWGRGVEVRVRCEWGPEDRVVEAGSVTDAREAAQVLSEVVRAERDRVIG
jgi:hypothetical protein